MRHPKLFNDCERAIDCVNGSLLRKIQQKQGVQGFRRSRNPCTPCFCCRKGFFYCSTKVRDLSCLSINAYCRYQSVVVIPSGYVIVFFTRPPGLTKSVMGLPCSARSILSCQMGAAPSTPVTLTIGELSLFPAQTPIT